MVRTREHAPTDGMSMSVPSQARKGTGFVDMAVLPSEEAASASHGFPALTRVLMHIHAPKQEEEEEEPGGQKHVAFDPSAQAREQGTLCVRMFDFRLRFGYFRNASVQ